MVERGDGFWPMFFVQASGALNDNLFKNIAVLVIAFSPTLEATRANQLVIAAGALFILPFALFSVLGGWLADRRDKSRLIRSLKWFELALMALGAVALVFNSITLMLVVTGLTGLQSALFGPCKYAILPQLLPPARLPRANALFQVSTFAVILVGTVVAGLVQSIDGASAWIASALVLGVALMGIWMAYRIPPAPPSLPAGRTNAAARSDRGLALLHSLRLTPVVMALGFLWFAAIALVGLLPGIARDVLGGDELTVTWLMCGLTVGVAVGFLCLEGVLHRTAARPLGLVQSLRLGAVLMLGALLLIAVVLGRSTSSSGVLPIAGLLLPTLVLGISAALYAVPLQTLLQRRPPSEWRARMIALSNLCNALAMMLASALSLTLVRWLDYSTLFLVLFALGMIWLGVWVPRVDFVEDGNTRSATSA